MDQNVNVEQLIRTHVDKINASVFASDELKQKIDNQIKEETCMKPFNKKKLIICIAAACLMVSTVCFAAGKVSSIVGYSSAIPDSTYYADISKMEEKAGYAFDSVEAFKNGYQFAEIRVGNVSGLDEQGNMVAKAKQVNITYKRTGGKEINFGICPIEFFSEGAVPEEGTIEYSCVIYKYVPADYELTDEDLKNMESGAYSINCHGIGQPIEIYEVPNVSWQKDGLSYSMGGFDLDLSESELREMAQEILDSGK